MLRRTTLGMVDRTGLGNAGTGIKLGDVVRDVKALDARFNALESSSSLLNGLIRELAAAPSGVGFIATCLDRLVAHLGVHTAVAVVDDALLGLQLFNAGRRPFDLTFRPSTALARGPGIHTEPTVVDDDDELSAIAHLCAVAFRLDRLHYESLHDPLTGLYNRRGFEEQLAQAVSRSLRYGWAFGLVLIDLDGFKAINDRLGHQGGDVVLREVADRLRHGLRSGDLAARVGGDEFALLLHTDDAASLPPVLHRLHVPVGVLDDPTDIEWAAGMALCPDEASTADELYRIADRRLYESKGPAATRAPYESQARS
jgi:diguanylate cyclase (GGDEF)-like protein